MDVSVQCLYYNLKLDFVRLREKTGRETKYGETKQVFSFLTLLFLCQMCYICFSFSAFLQRHGAV